MTQILVTRPAALTAEDREMLREAGIVCIETRSTVLLNAAQIRDGTWALLNGARTPTIGAGDTLP